MALWKAVSCCLELGFPMLHLEGDVFEVVQALQQSVFCWSHYGQLIEDTRIQLGSLQAWFVSHTRRETNEAAHHLTKVAIFRSLNFV